MILAWTVMAAIMMAAAPAADEANPEGRPAASQAPSSPTSEARFDALVKEIGVLRSDLEKLDRRERGIVNELDRLDVESALSSREMQRLAALKDKSARDLGRTRLELEARRGAVERREAELSSQLRRVYEMGRQRELRMILSLTEPVDVMRAIAYLDVMARGQSAVLLSLRRERAAMEALERAQRTQAESLAALETQRRGRSADLDRVRERSRDLLQATRQERDAHRRAIAEMARAAEELEAAIISGSSGPETADLRSAPRLDIGRLRGALEWPVSGILKVPFGQIRHPRFGTVTPHPGVEIETEPGSAIRAVLAGRVVFARRFSGYGNTVLLDHGGHYLSVYSRAAVLSVVEGEEVLQGQVLGTSADEAPGGSRPTVYFELRHERKAVDPAFWLKRKGAIRREEDR